MTTKLATWDPRQRLTWAEPEITGPDGVTYSADSSWLAANLGDEQQWRLQDAVRALLPRLRPAAEPRELDKLPALVAKKEAAAVLRCSERSIDRLVRTGMLRASRRSLGGSSRVLIDRASLLSYLGTIRA